MKQKICIYIAFLCCILTPTWAYQPENIPLPAKTASTGNGFVSNPDGILSAGAVEQINRTCYALYRCSEAELAVVAVRDIEGYDIADFAQRLFMHWGIGDKQRNTGVLLLLATDSRDIRIHTGGGIEGLLPDAECSRIISDVMVPYLAADQWDEGLAAGADAIAATLSTTEAQQELLLGWTPASSDGIMAVCVYLMIACLILIAMSILLYKDMRTRTGETTSAWQRRLSGTWQLLICATIFFPLPLFFLARWFYRHGGREIQAMLNAEARKRAAEAARHSAAANSGFYIGGSGFGGGSHRGGGFGGGFGGFGGGSSFGGGASGKF